ncbi:MAG: UDP-N-acetylglucosamine 2-epimerase (non-hydrolyzing) [bacterium]
MIPKKRIMLVFGTRPEAIKMAPVISEIAKYPEILDPIVVVTGQHREMLDQVLDIFKIKPDYDLKIMQTSQTLTNITVKVLEGLQAVMLRERPDMVLVQGDTTTTFAASLSAYYHKVSVGHVEAGLRTWQKYSPYPEEINRRLTTSLADLNFAPTAKSVVSLTKENVDKNKIYLTGNTVIDALFDVVDREYDLKKIGIVEDPKKKIILVTTHRRESFGTPLKNICEGIAIVASKHSEVTTVVLPVHKNPLVSGTVHDVLGGLSNVQLIEPLDYEPFIHLMKASYIILTDSGGVQEEAPSLGKPVLVLREVTERPEAVEAGAVRIVGTDINKITTEAEKLLTNKAEYDKMSQAINPYGDGKASERIVGAILHYFGFTDRRPADFIPSLQGKRT